MTIKRYDKKNCISIKAKLEKIREYAANLINDHPTPDSILAKHGKNLLNILGLGKPKEKKQ